MDIKQKIEFLNKYVPHTQFVKRVKIMLNDEGYFIASECSRRLGISKQHFSKTYRKYIIDSVQFSWKDYYKLKQNNLPK